MLTIIILSGVICALVLPVQTALDKKTIEYRLYTSNNPENYIICKPNNLASCNIDIFLDCKFLIHGYEGSAESDWVISTKNEYLKKGSYNIFAVDWSKLAKKIYFESVEYTSIVGKDIGYFIRQLHITKNVDYKQIHIIGHSMGAHAGGDAGKYIKSIASQLIQRITGLDPAGPGFFEKSSDQKLNKDDAKFVDVIHTDEDVFGDSDYNLAKIHFYPNGGKRFQPGCLSKRKRRDIIKPSTVTCSHTRAALYFSESVNSLKFISTKCESFVLYKNGLCAGNPTTSMGENVNTTLTESFYLLTNESPPYAKG